MGFVLFNKNYEKVPMFKEHTYYETVVVKKGRCECGKKETKDFLLKSGYKLIEDKTPIRVPDSVVPDKLSLAVLEKMKIVELKDTYKKVVGKKVKIGMSRKKIIAGILEK